MESKKTILNQSLSNSSDSASFNSFSKDVFDSIPYGIIVLEKIENENGNLNFIFKYQNRAAEEYFGKLENRSFKDCNHIFSESFLQKLLNVYSANTSLIEKFIFDGPKLKLVFDLYASKISNGLLISLLKLPSGKSSGDSDPKVQENSVQENSLSLDEAKEKIKELEKFNHLLESNFKNQFKELADKNLLLVKVNNDLDNFVYIVSHDLQSPISNIEGLLNALILELPSENPEVQHIISLLGLSLNKVKSLLNDLSEIAHVQNNDDEAELINLTILFQDVKFTLHEEVIKYGAVVEADFSKAQEIYFSRKNLTSIFTNLISNALKYSSPSRLPEVFITTSKTQKFFIISVKDNGLGIKPEDKEKIFSVFKRIYTHVAGSGVGLFIVKRIVDNNGGKIEIESEINKGTTFTLYLRNDSESSY